MNLLLNPTTSPPKNCDIAIIGLGFCGTLTLHHLAKQATQPLQIVIFDPDPKMPRSVVYSTTTHEHLLNVPSARMGALPDQVDHFHTWLLKQDTATITPFGQPVDLKPNGFVPRLLYGQYLEEILQNTLTALQKKSIQVHWVKESVQNLDATAVQWAVVSTNHRVICSQAILNCGLASPSQLRGQSPWDLKGIDSGDDVLILGMGLTAVDTICHLMAQGHKGSITCLSRHGQFSATHLMDPLSELPKLNWEFTDTVTLKSIEDLILKNVVLAKQQGKPWQLCFDSLRPHTQKIWQALSTKERAHFFKHDHWRWAIHRHRMAPQVRAQLKQALASGQLKVMQASADEIPIVTKHVVDCLGPAYNAYPQFLENLIAQKIVRKDETHGGIRMHDEYRLTKANHPPLYGTGAIWMGELLETTAVPELRGQAKAVAELILQKLDSLSDL